jgi:hypothetical protein
MADDKLKQDVEDEVWQAINAFEQILEAMPNDRASLEALSQAYSQIGDEVRSKEFSLRLAEVLIESDDIKACSEILSSLKLTLSNDPDVLALEERLISLGGGSTISEADAKKATTAEEKATATRQYEQEFKNSFDISEELAFAWTLLQNDELNQDEYSAIVTDLTEMSTNENMTVSMLHVLFDRGFRNLERVLGTVSKECGTPLVDLSAFDLQEETLRKLPLEFVVRRGAIPYEALGDELLVALLNPYDTKLREQIQKLAGAKCYFYLTSPESFDEALSRTRAMIGS